MAVRDPFASLIDAWDTVCEDAARGALDASEAETVRELGPMVDRFCAAEVDSLAVDREGRLGRKILDGAAELGLFGITVPAEYGGAGLSMLATTRVIAALARHDGSLATTVGLHSGLALAALCEHGAPALRARYLTDVAAGRRIASFAATEPEAGSDIASVRTTAEVASGELCLRGDKAYVTNGGFAGILTVLARTPGLGGARAGTSLLVVDPSWPGVQRAREEHKMGLRGSSTVTIGFDDVRVPMDHIVGEPGKGLELFQRALWWGRTLLSAGCLGSAEGAIWRAIEHVKTRKQFGRTLSRFGMVRRHVAVMRAREFAMSSLLATVGARHGRSADVGWESSACKLVCSEGAFEIIDTALQLHGGAGYLEETGLSRRLRDCRVTRIFEGANDVLRVHLGSAVLSWDRDAAAARPRLAARVGPSLEALAARVDGELDAAIAEIVKTARAAGFRLVDRQLVLGRMADALAELYALVAAFARVEGESRAGKDASTLVARLALLVDDTLPRVQRNVAALTAPVGDEAIEPVARFDLD
jgi:alkylation response protein AidB-like acyl-CoA dehydrogenase